MTASITAPSTSVGSRFRPSFYFWMTLAMCLFVFAGFGIQSFLPALQGNFPPAPPIVHLHGVVFVAWMLLMLAQSALVCSGNLKLHRALGTWGIAQGTATLLIGLMMQLIASGREWQMRIDRYTLPRTRKTRKNVAPSKR